MEAEQHTDASLVRTMNPLVIPIVFGAVLIQTLSGFGGGLIAMPLLIGVLGLETAAPAFALVMQLNGIIMIRRYHTSLDVGAVWRPATALLLCIPLGIWLAGQVDKQLVLLLLGMVTAGYALYALLGLHVPIIKNKRWGFLFGAAGGLLQGAYNTGGPPLIIYGTSQRWPPQTFKGNLQALFFTGGVVVVVTHLLTGHMTAVVLQNAALMLPALLIASRVGFLFDRFIQPEPFRKAVLVLLVVLGANMIL